MSVYAPVCVYWDDEKEKNTTAASTPVFLFYRGKSDKKKVSNLPQDTQNRMKATIMSS